MELVIVGKHVEVDAALRAHVDEKLDSFTRYASDLRRIDVEFGHVEARKAEDAYECDVLVHVNRKLVKGHGRGADLPRAFDRAAAKAEEQLRKLHGRRVDKPDARRDGGPGNHH